MFQILVNLFIGMIFFTSPIIAEIDSAVELDPVVVTATKTPHRLSDSPVITELITREEIEATGAENIGEVLEHKSGVIIHRDGHGDGVQLQGIQSMS